MEKVTSIQDQNHLTEQAERYPGITTAMPPRTPDNTTIKRLRALLTVIRPRQWTKNGAVFIGLVFAQQLFNTFSLERTLLACGAFCCASSSIYVLNDLLDLEHDRQHPVKRSRPLASGRLPISWAISAMGIMLLLCGLLTGCIFASPYTLTDIYASIGGPNLLFAACILAYLLLNVFYSIHLKHMVIVDVFCIAIGFVLRILAGAVVVPVVISPWLYLVTCFLSLFLALSKRRHETRIVTGAGQQSPPDPERV